MVVGPVGVALRRRLSDGDVDGQSRTEVGMEECRSGGTEERMAARPCILLEMRSHSTLRRLNSGVWSWRGWAFEIYLYSALSQTRPSPSRVLILEGEYAGGAGNHSHSHSSTHHFLLEAYGKIAQNLNPDPGPWRSHPQPTEHSRLRLLEQSEAS